MTPMQIPAKPRRILVVDDHRKIREPLAIWLRRHDFRVITAENAAMMWAMLRSQPVDLIVLDVMLPDGDGTQLCQQIQRRYGLPVILLTAKDTLDDRIQGLALGADDYIVKPFEPRELLARIEAILRRMAKAERREIDPPHSPAERCLFFAELCYEPLVRRLSLSSGQALVLSTMEGRLLETFLAHSGQILSRETLIDLCVIPGKDVFDRAIDRQVSRLRQRLSQLLPDVMLLDTVWGSGYRFTADVKGRP